MALSEEDLAKLQPGSLVLVDSNLQNTFTVFTVREIYQDDPVVLYLTTQEMYETTGRFWPVVVEEISSLIAPSLEAVPLEDWAGLAHLLHPKLKERVKQWLSQTKI